METLKYPTKTKARKQHKCSYCNGVIDKNEIYNISSHKYDGTVYTWKSHIDCDLIAGKLNWFEYCDEGLTMDDFIESAKNEWCKIMSVHFNDEYESKDFKIPSFKEQLDFIKKWHLTN